MRYGKHYQQIFTSLYYLWTFVYIVCVCFFLLYWSYFNLTILQKNGELRRKNFPLKVNGGFDLNFQTGHHQFPVFARQQQQQQKEKYAYQKGGDGLTAQYYPVPFFQPNAKVLQAAEARHRRKIKIKTKKNSSSLGIRSSIS